MRLAGNDHFVIKQASGAKTDSVFQRYNLVTEEEMKSIKWLDVQDENPEQWTPMWTLQQKQDSITCPK